MRRNTEEIKLDILKKANQWVVCSRLLSLAQTQFKSGKGYLSELVKDDLLEVRSTMKKSRRTRVVYELLEFRINPNGVAYLENSL